MSLALVSFLAYTAVLLAIFRSAESNSWEIPAI